LVRLVIFGTKLGDHVRIGFLKKKFTGPGFLRFFKQSHRLTPGVVTDPTEKTGTFEKPTPIKIRNNVRKKYDKNPLNSREMLGEKQSPPHSKSVNGRRPFLQSCFKTKHWVMSSFRPGKRKHSGKVLAGMFPLAWDGKI